MVARSRARYLAPIALIATITATYLVVHASLGSKHSTTTTTKHQVVLPTQTARAKASQQPSTYTVKSGDSLSSISVKTGIPVATLEALNPGIDPNALQTGQKLTLHR
jgi:LysM repeat protein